MFVSKFWPFKKSIYDLDVCGKRVLCRVDFNVPIKNGEIIDDIRIRCALPTIQYLMHKGAKVILLSHLGRPKGQVIEEMRVTPIAKRLSTLLDAPVEKMDEACGSQVEEKVRMMKTGQVLLLENVRFYPGEEQNDLELAKAFARLADIFVNDAFGVAHRIHASTVGVTTYLPSVLGLLMEKELSVLNNALSNPARPFTVIIGGAKVKDKIKAIEHLLDKVDNLMIGGGLVYTFLKAKGYEIGQSLLESSRVMWANRCLEKAKEKGVSVYLPIDIVVADHLNQETEVKTVNVIHIPVHGKGLDIGPKTSALYANVICNSKLVIWNGAMGVSEMQPFNNGTKLLAYALAKATSTFSIIGGGDTLATMQALDLINQMDHVSTGGGALLEFLKGETLPALKVLETT